MRHIKDNLFNEPRYRVMLYATQKTIFDNENC